MDHAARDFVRRQAGDVCEYYRLPQAAVDAIFHIEHIVARQHGGDDERSNLALACDRCNLYKGPNLTVVDPDTKQIVRLFHPRQHSWQDHFMFRGVEIAGLTETGRATVRLLNMNAKRRLQLRFEWMSQGELPT